MTAEKKQPKKEKKQKDHWFTLRGIRKEIKRVIWPRWKTTDKGPGIIRVTCQVVLFTGFFALFFVGCEFVVTLILHALGIGA